MKLSVCRVISLICVFVLALTLIILVPTSEATRWVKKIDVRFREVVHNQGTVTYHIVTSDYTYGYHESSGSHQHPTPTEIWLPIENARVCWMNSTCYICE